METQVTYVNYAGSLSWLMIFVVGVLILMWSKFLFRNVLKEQRPEKDLFNCDRCHYAFVAKEEVNLTRCPRCNAICIRKRRRQTMNRV